MTRAEEIVAAARLVLERDGTTGLTMQAVAAEMGIKAPSLYKHVTGKGAIELALVTSGLTEMGHALHAALAPWDSDGVGPTDVAITLPAAVAASAAGRAGDGSGEIDSGAHDRAGTVGTGDGTGAAATSDGTRAVGTPDRARTVSTGDRARVVDTTDRAGAVRGLLAAYRRQALAHPELYRLATAGRLPRDRLPDGLEDWAGRPFLLVTGDAHRAQALWSLAHGMVILELDDRYPAGCDLDRTWAEAASAFS